MARDVYLPWFPLWVSDCRDSSKVREMGPACFGIFVMMLMRQWSDGPLPNNAARVARLVGFTALEVEEHWQQLLGCFEEAGEGLLNRRLEAERAAQEHKHATLSAAGKKSARMRRKKGGSNQAGTRLKPGSSEVANNQNQNQIDTRNLYREGAGGIGYVGEWEEGENGLEWRPGP